MPHPFLPKPTWSEFLGFLAGACALILLIRWAARLQKSPTTPPLPEDPGQRRGDFRVPLSVPVEIRLSQAPAPMTGTLTDLSAGGATVMAVRAVPSGTSLALSFSVEGEAFDALPAEPVRTEASDSRPVLHCSFSGLPPSTERRLLRAVASRERGMVRKD